MSTIDDLLTQNDYNLFKRDGYLLIRGAIDDRAFLDDLETEIDIINADVRRGGYDKYKGEKIDETNHLIFPNFITRARPFMDLTIAPKVLPKIWGILGWNIYCYYSDLAVTPPYLKNSSTIPPTQIIRDWHKDSGRVNSEVKNNEQLSIKVAYFISDCDKKGMGNMYVVPGSHNEGSKADFNDAHNLILNSLSITQDQLHWKLRHRSKSIEAIKANRGDALLFDRRLWHSRSKNLSDVTRKVLFYGYCYRWLVGQKYQETLSTAVYGRKLPPILRQMLGIDSTADNVYYPSEDVVPLRQYIKRVR